MTRFSQTGFLVFCCSFTFQALAQAEAEPEQVSIAAFLVMCGFALLVILMIASVIAQGLLAYEIIPRAGRLGRAAGWLASMVSDIRVVDGPKNSDRRGSKGTPL